LFDFLEKVVGPDLQGYT